MLFDWLYPAHFPTILACMEAWAGGQHGMPILLGSGRLKLA